MKVIEGIKRILLHYDSGFLSAREAAYGIISRMAFGDLTTIKGGEFSDVNAELKIEIAEKLEDVFQYGYNPNLIGGRIPDNEVAKLEAKLFESKTKILSLFE